MVRLNHIKGRIVSIPITLPNVIGNLTDFNYLKGITHLCDKPTTNTSPNPSEHLFNNFSSQSIADLQALQINEAQLKRADNCVTLLEWIKSTDPQNRLDTVIDETREMLAHFDNNFTWPNLQTKIGTLVAQIENNPQMREIEGLTKRLQDLNNFLEMSKRFLASQGDIVESVRANCERASKLKDESILQDLCRGHEKQLEVCKPVARIREISVVF